MFLSCGITRAQEVITPDSVMADQQTVSGSNDNVYQVGLVTGELQTQNVGNTALNPALQPQINSLIGTNQNSGSSIASGLGSLAGAAAKLV